MVVGVESLEIVHRRCLGIFGPNGAGKTTLVRGMTGLLEPLEGEVRRPEGIRFGYLPQHRAMELHWPMTGFDAAAMGVSARRPLGWVGREEANAVRRAMAELGVDDLGRRPFGKLSGGQQQRLLLAGALAAEPSVLVLDEPTDGLDVHSRRTLLDLLAACGNRGLATVIISHEVEDLLELCDDVAWLQAGQEAGEASTVEVISPEELASRVVAAGRAGRGR